MKIFKVTQSEHETIVVAKDIVQVAKSYLNALKIEILHSENVTILKEET